MNEPRIAQPFPAQVALEPGIYSWCTCGYSQFEPYCDGAHIGKGFCPITFIVDKPQTLSLCQCKHTQTPPYCDGSHNRLPKA